jgi:16S rRNA (cytosine967-C5)-methyltransferase
LLVTTAERRLGQIDAVLGACQRKQSSEQRRSRVDQFVEAVLRIGAAQLLFLGVSPHAAVKETVDVLRMDKEIHVPEPKIKFVNAVLRRLAGEGPELLAATDVTDNAAPWLVEEWRQQWGEAVTRNILEAAMKESPRCLTVNLNWRGPAEDGSRRTAMQRIEYVASQFPRSEILPQGSIRVLKPPPGPISTWPLYQEGAWWCQDVSATLPGMALYQGVSCQGQLSVDDVHVIDLCAAPGGKAAHLSNYGFASVTAVELSSRRCVRLKQNMQRLGQNWNIVVADGCEWTPRESVGAVLLDVPCTATGTASKRPDVLRRSPDYAELLDVQYRLACHAADEVLQVGGILVYATCSLLKQESEDQVTKLLSRPTGATLRTVSFGPGEIPGFDDAIDANGWIRVLPGSLPGSLSQCDGFFVARLERIR